MPLNLKDAINPAREIANNAGTIYQLQDINHDEIVNQINTNEQNITANAERVQANETELAAHDAYIKELQKNNPVVEIKDTVTENTESNYETHDFKETTSDGTENAVSNFVLAQKQITEIKAGTTAGTITIDTINQSGTAESKNIEIALGESFNIDKVYPIGSIYLSANSTNPSALFGGTWEQLKDRFLLGAGDTYEAGSTGGEAKHTLTIAEMPTHHHGASNSYAAGYPDDTTAKEKEKYSTLIMSNENSTDGSPWYQSGSTGAFAPLAKINNNTGDVGGSTSHNNMPPYLAVYMWQRTA